MISLAQWLRTRTVPRSRGFSNDSSRDQVITDESWRHSADRPGQLRDDLWAWARRARPLRELATS